MAEVDDRGKAFAVEVQRPIREPDREPWIAFCFDIKIAPGPVDTPDPDPDGAFQRAVQARTEFFLPTTVERVWWLAGLGECKPVLVRDLEQAKGTNLGSRPERFRELTARMDWRGVCDDALKNALTAVHKRDRVVRRLTEARERATGAQERESVIRRARSHTERQSLPDDVMAAVTHALAHPVFSLDSCGAVFITWAQQP
ncbi:MAG: hypothetical protein ACLP9Y_15545 [Mycobacterium sp.]